MPKEKVRVTKSEIERFGQPMTVKELIKELQTMPEDAEITGFYSETFTIGSVSYWESNEKSGVVIALTNKKTN